MQFHTLQALSLLAAFISTTHATCFHSGIDGDQNTANNNLRTICTGALGGDYLNGDIKSYCLSTGLNRYNFRIYNLKPNTQTMNPDGCVDRLQREVRCAKGGDRTYEGEWRFVADPNSGNC